MIFQYQKNLLGVHAFNLSLEFLLFFLTVIDPAAQILEVAFVAPLINLLPSAKRQKAPRHLLGVVDQFLVHGHLYVLLNELN